MVFHTTLIFISQSSTVLTKNCLCQNFFQNIVLWAKKRTWFVTQIQIITKKSSTYTQGDYCGLSYVINIYIPEFHRFDKNCLCQNFLQNIVLWAKKRTWFVTQIQIITKKKLDIHSKGTIVVFYSYDINIYTAEFRHFEKKLLMSRISWKKFILLSQKRTWLVTQIHVITKKARHTLKETIVVFRPALIFISQISTVLRKRCLCPHFLQNIVLWAKKERDLSRKYRL